MRRTYGRATRPPSDDVRIPRGSTKPDWEVELGIVVGRRTSYLDSVEGARDAIAGWLNRPAHDRPAILVVGHEETI